MLGAISGYQFAQRRRTFLRKRSWSLEFRELPGSSFCAERLRGSPSLLYRKFVKRADGAPLRASLNLSIPEVSPVPARLHQNAKATLGRIPVANRFAFW
jgi:hypothetical protein